MTPEAPGSPPRAAALGAFFANAGHQLRSPLGVISTSVRELQAQLDASMTNEQRQLLSLAERGLLRFARMADSLTLLGALESGTLQLRASPVDGVEMVAAAIAHGVAVEPRREVTVASNLAPTPCMVNVDGPRLRQALVEIVINAIRHAHRHVRVEQGASAARITISIEDDGQGLSSGARAVLFERFVPGSESGLGVGLSLAHDVIVAHGGTLRLQESRMAPGRAGTVGACMVVDLPRS